MKRNVVWILGILLVMGLLALSVERATNPGNDARVALQSEGIRVDRISCRHFFLSRAFSCAGRLDPRSLAAVEEYRVLDRDDPDELLRDWYPGIDHDEMERCSLLQTSFEAYQFHNRMPVEEYRDLAPGLLFVNDAGRFCFFSGHLRD